MSVFRTKASATGPINLAHTVPTTGQTYEVTSVTCKFSAAPASAGTFYITLDSGLGEEYDATLYSVDPSVSAVTSVVWVPTSPMYLQSGDAVRVTYTNPSARVYGVVITVRSA